MRNASEKQAKQKRTETLRNWGREYASAKVILLESQAYIDAAQDEQRRMLENFIAKKEKERTEIEQQFADASQLELVDSLSKIERYWETKHFQDAKLGKRLVDIYQHQCFRRMGMPVPFDTGTLEQVIDRVDSRNIYAHVDSTTLQDLGVGHVIASIDDLLQAGDILERNSICPSLIVIIGVGKDAMGRDLVLFTQEREFLAQETLRPTRVRWMFKAHGDLRPYKPYYIISNQYFGAVDPFMVDAQIILSNLHEHKIRQ